MGGFWAGIERRYSYGDVSASSLAASAIENHGSWWPVLPAAASGPPAAGPPVVPHLTLALPTSLRAHRTLSLGRTADLTACTALPGRRKKISLGLQPQGGRSRPLRRQAREVNRFMRRIGRCVQTLPAVE